MLLQRLICYSHAYDPLLLPSYSVPLLPLNLQLGTRYNDSQLVVY
jgi:hypothetical protein